MLPPPPMNFTGGNASSGTGGQDTGGVSFGAFNYNDKPPYVLFAVLGLVAVWMITKR